MKTVFGTEINENIKAVLYLCQLSNHILHVRGEILFEDAFQALNAYANIPNPESQLVIGNNQKEFIEDLELLHKNMKDPKWVKDLEECI